MFGFGRNLRRVGLRAYAEVLSAEQTALSVPVGNPNLMNNTEIRWELQVHVLPDIGPPFDATVHALLPRTSAPRPGSRVAVRYDPKDHSRIELDLEPVSTADAAIEAITKADPGLMSAQVMGMPMTDVIRQAIADPAAFREQMMARREQAHDPVDRLERLAALRDRGLITDEEFEQQKRRILGEP